MGRKECFRADALLNRSVPGEKKRAATSITAFEIERREGRYPRAEEDPR